MSYLRLAGRGLGVTDTRHSVSQPVVPAAGSMQAGLAAATADGQ